MEHTKPRKGYYAITSYRELAAGYSNPEPVQHLLARGKSPHAAQPSSLSRLRSKGPIAPSSAPRPAKEPAPPLASPPLLFVGCFLLCWQSDQLLWQSTRATARYRVGAHVKQPVRRRAAALLGSRRLRSWDCTSSRHQSQDEDLLIGSCTALVVHTNRLILIVLQEPIYLISFQKYKTHFLLIGQ